MKSPTTFIAKSAEEPWPRPDYVAGLEPHFLFILTPPHSGSTALAKILGTGKANMLLQKKGEGQWLVPGLCIPERWCATMPVDYESVKAVWLNRYQQRLGANGNLDVVIEKSPPNLLRIRSLVQQFNRYSLLAYNRNPIANCASRLHRENNASDMNGTDRIEALARYARSWLDLSGQIRDLVLDLRIPLISYEEFCLNTVNALEKAQLPELILRGVNPGANVQIKDYPVAAIANKNSGQINLLSPGEISHIIRQLEPETDLLSFFGYAAEFPTDYKQESSHQ